MTKLVQSLRDFAQDLRKDAKWGAAAAVASPLFGSAPRVAGLAAVLVYALMRGAPVLLELLLAAR